MRKDDAPAKVDPRRSCTDCSTAPPVEGNPLCNPCRRARHRAVLVWLSWDVLERRVQLAEADAAGVPRSEVGPCTHPSGCRRLHRRYGENGRPFCPGPHPG